MTPERTLTGTLERLGIGVDLLIELYPNDEATVAIRRPGATWGPPEPLHDEGEVGW